MGTHCCCAPLLILVLLALSLLVAISLLVALSLLVAISLSEPCFFAGSSPPKHLSGRRPRLYPASTQEPLEQMVLPPLPKLQSFWAQPQRSLRMDQRLSCFSQPLSTRDGFPS